MNKRIQWFKKFYRLDRFTNPTEPYLPSSTDISYDDLLWLVEQAEVAEQLRNENKKLTRISIESNEGYEYWKDKYQQAQDKVKRYEEALKEIIAIDDESGSVGYLLNKAIRIAKQAVEVKNE